jgi:hypothetical protein
MIHQLRRNARLGGARMTTDQAKIRRGQDVQAPYPLIETKFHLATHIATGLLGAVSPPT